jgi:hypothetical protein
MKKKKILKLDIYIYIYTRTGILLICCNVTKYLSVNMCWEREIKKKKILNQLYDIYVYYIK